MFQSGSGPGTTRMLRTGLVWWFIKEESGLDISWNGIAVEGGLTARRELCTHTSI